MKRIKFLFTLVAILLAGVMSAQNITVKGVVTDRETGEPIPFASIQVKGTTTGAAADTEGCFSLTVSTNATLVFSSIGYIPREVPVDGRGVIDVILSPDSEALDDVIVIAYGTAKKESVTGAVATVKSSEISKRPVSSVTDILEGQVSGIMVNSTYGEPGADASIRIRGFGSVNGSNSPLYVIDGVPFGGNVSDLNPNDIESLTVLKDATSAALYGNRASNGVILITTKRGTSDKVTVTASVAQGAYMRGIPEYSKVDAVQFMQIYMNAIAGNFMATAPASYPTRQAAVAETKRSLWSNLGQYNVFNVPDDQLFDENGYINPNVSVRPGFDDLNWYDHVERIGYRQEYNVSGNGASEKSNYYFSLGYLDENGQIHNSDFNRWTGRANVNLTPVKWLKTGFNVSGSMQESNGISTGTSTIVNPLYFARMIAPIYPIYRHDMSTGAYLLDEDNQKQYDDGVELSRQQLNGRHVIWENELDRRNTIRNTLGAQAFADIKFLKDFTFSIKGDISIRGNYYRSYSNSIIGDGKGNVGRASRTRYLYKNFTFQQLLNWNHSFGDHTVEALIGHENYSYGYDYEYGYKTSEIFPNGYELDNFNTITSLDGSCSGYTLESYLARAKYDYKGKYYVEGSFRRDGSSRFAPENRWGNFWSAGATWIISKEDFLNQVSWIDNLKLRGSYGQVGNDTSCGYYAYMALYSIHQYANHTASYKIQNEARDIVWESANTFSVALEGRMFDRWNWSLEYFDKVTKDLLFDVYQPLSAGATATSSAESTTTQNLGSVANRGFEINTDVDIIRTKDFRWNFSLNATMLRNKVLVLPEQNKDGIISGTKRILEGRGIYDFWLYQYAGVDMMTGRALYLLDDEKYYIGDPVEGKSEVPVEWASTINGQSYVLNTTYAKKDWSGSAIPKLNGSFSTSFSYKNFSLSALFTYALGGKLIDYSYMDLMSASSSPHSYHTDLLNSWSSAPAGMSETSSDRISTTAIPEINGYWSSYSNSTSTRFLTSSNYLVIKNIALSYSLPKTVVQKIGLNNLTVNVAIDNLATFSAMKGLNPQQSFAGTVDNYFNTPRVATAGIKITF
jgi:TonB-linked SusC/RagA family outer membrane protein